MYVKKHIVEKVATTIMVDTSATHNLISEGEAKKLGLKLEKDLSHMKIVNSKSFTTIRMVKQVTIKFGSLQRRANFVVT